MSGGLVLVCVYALQNLSYAPRIHNRKSCFYHFGNAARRLLALAFGLEAHTRTIFPALDDINFSPTQKKNLHCSTSWRASRTKRARRAEHVCASFLSIPLLPLHLCALWYYRLGERCVYDNYAKKWQASDVRLVYDTVFFPFGCANIYDSCFMSNARKKGHHGNAQQQADK